MATRAVRRRAEQREEERERLTGGARRGIFFFFFFFQGCDNGQLQRAYQEGSKKREKKIAEV